MKITNNKELQEAAIEAGALLQSINDYLSETGETLMEIKESKVRFPRGYLRTAAFQRNRMPFIEDHNLKSNLAYTLILSDAVLWLFLRTDISGTAGEMLRKLYLFLIGSLTESITKDYLKGICGKSYKVRTEYLLDKGIIDSVLKEDLDWLWDIRNKMHLFQLEEREYLNDYNDHSHSRAILAFRGLVAALKNLKSGGG